MIKRIYSNSKYMQVCGGEIQQHYVYNYGHDQGPQNFTGQVRYNHTNCSIEFFDGNIWQVINPNTTQVDLTSEAEDLLDWARQKRQDEIDLRLRMEKHPGLKDAYEKFTIVDILTKENK